MELTIASFYNEPGYCFSISYKVDVLIQQKLNEMIIVPYGINMVDPNTYLKLIVMTSSKTKSLKITGPEFYKRDNFINWVLWLPYKEIAEAKDQLVPYIKFFFLATMQVLKNYNVNEEDIKKVQSIIESEVINNPIYVCEEEEPDDIDLSDLGL